MSRETPPPQVSVHPNSGGIVLELNDNDVLSGHSNSARFHPGSVALKTVIAPSYKDEYEYSDSNRERAHVAARLVEEIRGMNPPGRFLEKRKDGSGGVGYVEIGDQKAWQKAAKALRDASNKNNSNNNRNNNSNNGNGNSKGNRNGKNNNNNNTQPPTVRKKAKTTKKPVQKRNVPSKINSNNLPSASSLPHNRGRLVIVRPSSKSSPSHQRDDADECGQWPFYRRHCETYGFSVEVERLLTAASSPRREGGRNSNAASSPGQAVPQMKLLLMDHDENGNNNGRAKRITLQCASERLVVRPCDKSHNKKSSKSSLHPDLRDGDIIQTLDGKPDPTFATLYAMMCRKEKLVLELVDENNYTSSREAGRRTANAREATVRSRSISAGAKKGTPKQASDIDGSKAAKTSNTPNSSESASCSRGEIEPVVQLIMDAKVSTARDGLNSAGPKEALNIGGSKAATASDVSNSSERSSANSYSRGEREPVTLPAKRRRGQETEATLSEIGLIFEDPSHKSKSPLSQQAPGDSSSREIPSNKNKQPTGAFHRQQRIEKDTEQSKQEPHPSANVCKTPCREVYERINKWDDEAALFEMIDQQLKEQCQKDQYNSQRSGGKAVDISSSSPTTFDSAGNYGDSIFLPPSSHSSTSSDSDSSSSSDSDSSSSSDSDSSDTSESSNSSDNNGKNHRRHPIQSLQNNAAQSSTTQYRPVQAPRDAAPSVGGSHKSFSNKQIFQPLNQNALATRSSLSLQAPRKLPPPSQNKSMSSSTFHHTAEAPTSLSRLWPDPSDAIKALTRWQPPSASVGIDSRGKRTIEFYGAIQCHHEGLENERKNPLPQTRWQPPAASVGIDSRGKRTIESYGAIQCHREGLENERKNPLLQHNLKVGSRDFPKEFKNASEIMETMAYPLMKEGLNSINGDYHADKYDNGRWNRDLYHLRLKKLTEVEPIFRTKSYFCGNIKMYEAQFSANGETNLPPSNLSELYCMYFPDWQDCKFGIVAHDFPTTISFRRYNEGKAFLKLWFVVQSYDQYTKQTGWLSHKEFKKLLDPHKNGLIAKQDAIFTMISCGSTTNSVRQFEAVKCLPYLKPHLQKALFTSYNSDSPKPSSASTKPRSLPIDIWRSLTASHNSYQLSSISRVLTGSCRDNVCLLHGPPGTGKSSTIVGLVSALLSGKAPLPKQNQSGCLIHPGKTMGASYAEPQARNRILVCAATNQAVDHLAWKIKQGSIGPSGKIGDFVMSRFGSLPWDLSRGSTDQKPKLLTEMEDFLYEINVDRRASDGMQNFEYDHDPQEEEMMCWSPEKRKPKRRKRRKIVGRAKLRSQILSGSSVVLATLSGSGSKAFIDAVCRDPTRNDSEFDAVIIDEACQASEPESLIPFKYNPTTITLVGDPKQLPVLTLSGSSPNSKLFERSLFERLQSLNFPSILLCNQYRMHENIAAFPSKQFYDGKLITPDIVKDRLKPPWHCPCFPTICFWDMSGRKMTSNPLGHGFSNNEEADFITDTLLANLAHTFLKKSDVEVTVGIISFYRNQVRLLKEKLARIHVLKNSLIKVKVATVDGFQGSECDIIILSCVRSHSASTRGGKRKGAIGFLNDNRRVNVALTRAKYSLWIVGNSQVLETSELWKKLIEHMNNQRVLHRGDKFRDMFAQWMASKESQIVEAGRSNVAQPVKNR